MRRIIEIRCLAQLPRMVRDRPCLPGALTAVKLEQVAAAGFSLELLYLLEQVLSLESSYRGCQSKTPEEEGGRCGDNGRISVFFIIFVLPINCKS